MTDRRRREIRRLAADRAARELDAVIDSETAARLGLDDEEQAEFLDEISRIVAGIRDAARQASGQQPDNAAERCGRCRGSGLIADDPEDATAEIFQCDHCHGTGFDTEHPGDCIGCATPAAGVSDTQPTNADRPLSAVLVSEWYRKTKRESLPTYLHHEDDVEEDEPR